MKRVAKAVVLFLASTLYAWLLFVVASSFMMSWTLKEPDTIKGWLNNSGMYNKIVPEVSRLATIQQKQENALVQITAEDITEAAKVAFPADTLRSDAERVVDAFYAWLKGDTDSIDFTVDFSGRQTVFAELMTAKLEEKINNLPACTTTGRFTVQAFDPFKADCKPKNVDLTEELAEFKDELAKSEDILPKVTYSGDDITLRGANGEAVPLSQELSWLPKAYRFLVYAPWTISVMTFISALALIFFSTLRRKGLRRVAGGLTFTGVIMLVSGVFLRPAFERLNSWSTGVFGAQASVNQNIFDPIFYEISKTYARYSIIFGVAYMVPATIIYASLVLTRHKQPEEQRHPHAEDHEDRVLTKDEFVVDQVMGPVPTEQKPHAYEQLNRPITEEHVATEPLAQNQPPHPISVQPPTRPVTRRPPMIQG